MPIDLLLVCHQVHNEAANILYSENIFYLDCCDRSAIRYVINLSHWALASLRTIHIFFAWPDSATLYQFEITPLLHTDPHFRVGLQRWMYLCETLSQTLPLNRMSLSFSCKVADLVTAQIALDPLKSLPRLYQIRLDVGESFCNAAPQRKQIESMLKSVAAKLTMPASEPRASFPFWSLPCEIRLMILSQTGLIVDTKIKNNLVVNGGICEISLNQRASPLQVG